MSGWTRELPNGYTISVIDNGYGRDAGLLEVAAWDTHTGDWALDRPPFNGDVLGWLTKEEAAKVVALVEGWEPVK